MARRTLAIVAGALTALLAVTACSAGEPSPVEVTATPGSTATRGTPPAPVVPTTWPLTGVEADDITARPALAIKVENSVQARPQTGLEFADMVWEEVVEGGITRYVAVFNSQIPDAVMPIRSARSMDAAIAAPLGGILAFSGAQQGFIAEIRDAGVQTVIQDAGNAGFARDGSRRAPHNVVGTPQTFLDQAAADRKSPPPAQFTHARAGQGSATTSGTAATHASVRMSGQQTTVWDWNADASLYERSDGTTPSVSTTGARHSAANVLIIGAQMVDTGTRDPAGNPVPETQLVGSGDGVLLSGGGQVALTWSKASVGDLMVLTGADGAPVTLEPGATWIQLVPTNASGSWTVE